MNILYVSALEGGKYSGPLHSVPKQILSQKKIDNVYWVNLTSINENILDGEIYNNYKCLNFSFEKLPFPFNNPDLIIFEEFFKLENYIISRIALKKNIPYVIVPRCQMTEKYFLNKHFKKILAWKLAFERFAKEAKAVQFLSQQELFDSKKYYSGNSIVIPNGIELADREKKKLQGKQIIGTFIGRYSVWQKGLDLLIEAVSLVKDDLEKNNVVINLYGPNERTGSIKEIQKLVEIYKVKNVVNVFGPVYSSEKDRVLENTDFFIHTSRFEGLPMSVLEALSYGIPCLVTPGTNIKDKIEGYNAGWVADENVDSIASSLKLLCLDIDNFDEYANNAIELAKSYSWDTIAKQSHYELLKVINKKGEYK